MYIPELLSVLLDNLYIYIRGGRVNTEVVGLFCGGRSPPRNFGVASPLFAIVNVIYSMKKWWGYAPPLPKVVGLKPHQPHLLCRPCTYRHNYTQVYRFY